MERKSWALALYWVIPALLPIGFLLAWLFSSPSTPRVSSKTSLVDFSATMLDGSSFQTLSYRGKWLLVEFWATTCGSCLEMMPTIERFYTESRNTGLDVIAIEIRADAEEAKKIQKDMAVSFPMALDVFRVAHEYDISVVPTLMLIDPEGKIRAREEGGHSIDQLYRMVIDAGAPLKV